MALKEVQHTAKAAQTYEALGAATVLWSEVALVLVHGMHCSVCTVLHLSLKFAAGLCMYATLPVSLPMILQICLPCQQMFLSFW